MMATVGLTLATTAVNRYGSWRASLYAFQQSVQADATLPTVSNPSDQSA